MTHILVADDDPHIREVICFALSKAGMKTTVAIDGTSALAAAQSANPDLVVLDVGMPGMDGLEVCRELRKTSDTPILFLSARDEEIDRVLGLEMGGDDYVTKPFSPRELVARVNVILRRAASRKAVLAVEEQQPLRHGNLTLDSGRRAVTFADAPVALTALEFSIISRLIEKPGHVLNRARIMAEAYGGRIHVADRTVDSHIRNIRAKFASAGCSDVIETVNRVGFRLGSCGG
jgi:two-component system OmpR family response regulator